MAKGRAVSIFPPRTPTTAPVGGSAPRVPSPRKPSRYGSHGCRAAPVPRERGRWLRHSIPFIRSGALWQNHSMPPRCPVHRPRGGMLPPCPLPCLPPPVPLEGEAPPVPVQPNALGCAFAHMGPRSPLRHINMPPLRFWSYGHYPPWFVRAPSLWG